MDLGRREVFGAHVVVDHQPGARGGLRGILHWPQPLESVVVQGKQNVGPVQGLLGLARIPVEDQDVVHALHPVEGLIRRVGQKARDLLSDGAQVAGQRQRCADGVGIR